MRSEAEASGMPTHAFSFLFFFCMSTSAAGDDGFPAAVECSMKTTKASRCFTGALGAASGGLKKGGLVEGGDPEKSCEW